MHLVDIKKAPIDSVTETGLRAGGVDYPLDILVLATGYDAITGSVLRLNVEGRGGRKLRDEWADGAQTYLGLCSAGFPNFFIISGPGSPAVLTNVVYSIEQHVDWVADCFSYLREQKVDVIEAEEEAQSAWGDELNAMASFMPLIAQGDSWYMGTNVPGKPRRFMIHLNYPGYVARCEQLAAEGYAGFKKEPA